MTSGPLDGVRIADLGRGAAARLAATLLGDLGASVERAPDGPGPLLQLLDRCDVALEDGLLDALGLAVAPIRAGSPGLVVVRISQDDRQAGATLSGMAAGARAGVHAPPLSRAPRFSPIPVVETLAGLTAALGAVAALVARERDGRGQLVAVPLLDSAYAAVETLLALSDRAPSAWHGIRWAASPFVGPYRCADGRWVFVHLGLATHVERWLRLLASEGLIRQVQDLKRAMSEQTRADPSAVGTPTEASLLEAQLRALFEERPAARWEEILGGAGLCCVMARTGAEWRSSPQAACHLADGRPAPWIRLGPGSKGSKSKAPTRGEPDDRPPLAGLRVLELTQVIAGPVAGRALAELGAEVIRIEHPSFRPAWSEAFHAVFDPGKASATVDLDPAAAQAILRELQPDVVLSNWRTGVDARLGLAPKQVRAICPDAVVVRLNAWGADGPWSRWPGWEQTVQAATGMQLDYGDGVPELVPLPVNDEATGMAAALGAVAALFGRIRGQGGRDVHTSLAATATWLQRDWLSSPSGRIPRSQRGAALGAGPRARYARARDGWLWLEGGIEAIPGLEELDPLDQTAVDRAIRRRRVATWVERARGIPGVCAAPWRTLGQAASCADAPIFRDPQPGLGRITRVEPPLRLERTPVLRLGAASVRGADGDRLGGAVPVLEPDPVRERTVAARVQRRAAWLAATARWGAWMLASRLAPVLVAGLLACGGGGVEPVVPVTTPFEPLGDSVVRGEAGSNGGLGISASARPVRELWVDRDPEGRPRVSWLSGELRSRSFDGSGWTDASVALSGEGAKVLPWQVGPGPAVLGVDLEGARAIPAPELKVEQGGLEQPWTGAVTGTWTTDPQGRVVLAHFAGPRVVVRRWDGQAWTVLGEEVVPGGYRAAGRQGPALAFDPAGEPVVAWREPYEVEPRKGGRDRYKSTRWRTWVKRWTGREWQALAGGKGELEEDPTERYPQPEPGDDRNPRAEWEAAQRVPPVVALAGDRVVVAWDTLDGVQVWEHRESWRALPDPVDLPGDAEDVDLFAVGDEVAIAWAHRSPRQPREIQVRVLADGAWSAPGGVAPSGISATAGPSIRPRLGTDGNALLAAWVDVTSGAHEVLVARFDGERWVGMPEGRRQGGLDGRLPAIAGPGPVLARIGDGPRLLADRWPEGALEPLELPLAVAQIHLASGAGRTTVLWDQRGGSGHRGLFAAQQGEGGWELLGPRGAVFDEGAGAYEASLAADRAGLPWVAWAHGGRAIQVRHWDGSRWVALASPPGQSVVGYAPSLALGDRGRPWLLWLAASSNRELDLKLAWFDGTEWQPVGESWWVGCDANTGGAPPAEAALALDEAGRPVVAWVSAPPRKQRGKARGGGEPPMLNVCRWSGDRWVDLPSPARGLGIRTADARRSHLALTASDGPVVAWSEAGEGDRQIHAARWSGERWVGLGDRGGVVSDCEGACWSPAMSLGPEGRCIAWEQMGDRDRRVSLVCQPAR